MMMRKVITKSVKARKSIRERIKARVRVRIRSYQKELPKNSSGAARFHRVLPNEACRAI
ncbi:MAG: hypothetical protein ACI909_003254 [Planctomycetota bacterium]|jgi:hypothetical protein